MGPSTQFAREIQDQLGELLEIRRTLQGRSVHDDLSDLPEESGVLASRLQAALDRFTVPGSTYGKAAEVARPLPSHVKIPELSAIAQALLDDLAKGWIRGVTELIHAETFADMLEVASELLDKGYKDSAAVVAGTALEVHLRTLSSKYGLDVKQVSGKYKKADTLNAELKKEGAYSPLQQKQVTAWLDLRNSAAHGHYSEYDISDVKRLMEDVGLFIDKYPA